MSGEKDVKTQKGQIMNTIVNMALMAITKMAENIPCEGKNEIYDDADNIVGYQHGCATKGSDNPIIISTCARYDEETGVRRGTCHIITVDAVSFEPHTMVVYASDCDETDLFSVSSVTGELGNLNDTDDIEETLLVHIKNIFSMCKDI